ncbi:DUF2207 domain-containing protein [Collinsella sp. An2]|uniref:DUF2207 domain-containing protein n=1 Tax=Collinsella sp. An2 TaxID=1965585 RepID=UPI001EF66803|nr:DUF2207 domain-containing protein [Collinsella sp. An2]
MSLIRFRATPAGGQLRSMDGGPSRRQGAPRGFATRLIAALVLVCAIAVARPASAYADSFETERVDISAAVLADGGLQVTELRTMAFDDDVNGVFWSLPLAENQQGMPTSYHIDAVQAIDEDGTQRAFSQVDNAQNGDRDVYTTSLDSSQVQVKLFSPQEDGDEVTFSISYTLRGAVMAWPDTAELYWQFVGPGWEDESNDVSLKISFPVADLAADTNTDAKAFRAWGHGPLDASVALDLTVPEVTYTVPAVDGGEFAEARVVFPLAWVPDLTVPQSVSGEERMQTVLSEEQRWADEANARREQARTVTLVGSIVLVSVGAVLLVAMVVLKLTRGRSSKPSFQETYFRDVPSQDHPAVIAAFMGSDVPDNAFIATLMHLTDDGIITLNQETVKERRLLGGSKEVEDYRMTLQDPTRVTDSIDRAAIDLYFGPGAQAGDSVLFGSLDQEAKHSPTSYSERIEAFKSEVRARLEMRGLVASTGAAYIAVASVLGAIVIVGAVFFMALTDGANLPASFVAIALAAVAIVVSFTFKRYSQEGVELRARCEALKRWLEDFTRLDEAVPDDLILWNKLLVMAVALDVSDEVLRALADAVPVDRRMDPYGGYYFPLYWWCYPHGGMGSPAHEMHGVHQATISQLASSADSSAGGFGGGFSGGGGGGVGGGGGGSF